MIQRRKRIVLLVVTGAAAAALLVPWRLLPYYRDHYLNPPLPPTRVEAAKLAIDEVTSDITKTSLDAKEHDWYTRVVSIYRDVVSKCDVGSRLMVIRLAVGLALRGEAHRGLAIVESAGLAVPERPDEWAPDEWALCVYLAARTKDVARLKSLSQRLRLPEMEGHLTLVRVAQAIAEGRFDHGRDVAYPHISGGQEGSFRAWFKTLYLVACYELHDAPKAYESMKYVYRYEPLPTSRGIANLDMAILATWASMEMGDDASKATNWESATLSASVFESLGGIDYLSGWADVLNERRQSSWFSVPTTQPTTQCVP